MDPEPVDEYDWCVRGHVSTRILVGERPVALPGFLKHAGLTFVLQVTVAYVTENKKPMVEGTFPPSLSPVKDEWTTAGLDRNSARDRVVGAASALFYAHGVRGVGVDRIVRSGQVTKATFYRHFPSKEDLVLAYL